MKYVNCDPIQDHDDVMTTIAKVVCDAMPGYHGNISMTFLDLPFPPDPRATWRGNVMVRDHRSAEDGPIQNFRAVRQIALELGVALDQGWLNYGGDLVLHLHAAPAAESFPVTTKSGQLLVLEFGSEPGVSADCRLSTIRRN